MTAPNLRGQRFALALAVSGAAFAAAAPGAHAQSLPEIRITASNQVPRCVTPERLMAYLKERNSNLSPRFRDIANQYRRHGEAWRVRWDYAFFQMALETNFLTYRAPNGRMGDVDPKQNNFAGIGTTGGGVPGDSFPDVSTGVLGQIQHLVAYSGEEVAEPVAPRTRLKQVHILSHSRALNRTVRFSDLAKRWAADPKYGRSIEWVASQFRAKYCSGRQEREAQETLPWQDREPQRGAAAQPVKAKKPPALAKAGAAASPVKTVWNATPRTPQRDEPRAVSQTPAAPKVAAVVPPVAVAPIAPTHATPVDAAPTRAAPPADSIDALVARTAVEPPVAHEDRSFAFLTPPAGLADAKIPAPEERVAADVPQGPVAVEGASVGGFMVASDEAPPFDRPAGLGASGLSGKPGRCVIEASAGSGTTPAVLVKTSKGDDVHYVALSVIEGFEDAMTKSFLAARPEGGEALGAYPSREAALVQARTLCKG